MPDFILSPLLESPLFQQLCDQLLEQPGAAAYEIGEARAPRWPPPLRSKPAVRCSISRRATATPPARRRISASTCPRGRAR